MTLRELLQTRGSELFNVFIDLTSSISPILSTIEHQFPEFTRHDPSHNIKLESISLDILAPEVLSLLSTSDLFALLCALWLHDAGMGEIPELRDREWDRPEFQEKLAAYRRLARSEEDCWRDYVREHHHLFCPFLAKKFLKGRVSTTLETWIGLIARSHGEKEIHDHRRWHKVVAVANDAHLHPPLLAIVLRLADILHFNYDRAPEYMFEHRKVSNAVSIQHWKAHQVAADYTVVDDICYFDGATEDDEAYWFSLQFTKAMDQEVSYCKQDVLPWLDAPFQKALSFSRVENRIHAINFRQSSKAVALRVDTPKMISDLLNDSLYAGRPTWFREILQNAFDACRDRSALDPAAKPSVKIEVWTDSEAIEFSDLGIGMQPSTVENYLFVAGASYWSSLEYKGSMNQPPGHVGRFGIGFMSLFSVADEIEVLTRHLRSNDALKYLVRGPQRVIRVELSDRPEPGTSLKIRLKKGTLLSNDVIDLFDNNCSFPEFPTRLILDGSTERDFPEPTYPSTTRRDIKLTRNRAPSAEAKLLVLDVALPGLRGDFYLPKILLPQLNAFIPDLQEWLKNAGWSFTGKSQVYFGGINYPPFYSVNDHFGFTHMPSLGSLRLAVSPNQFPLEMNLARDQFVAGPATRSLHKALCDWFDNVLYKDLKHELAGKNPDLRSAITARYSWTISLHLWLGQVPSPSAVAGGLGSTPFTLPPTPWPLMTGLVQRELRLDCQDPEGQTHIRTIEELLEGNVQIFAVGRTKSGISEALLRNINSYNPKAQLLIGLPDIEFGIKELLHWAVEEFLVPVPEHSRCAYGLRLAKPERPFFFFPRELDLLGIPVVSGPHCFAVLDYRDQMAEAKYMPIGQPVITGVLNRQNVKAKALIDSLAGYENFNQFRRLTGRHAKLLKEALNMGADNEYRPDNRKRLAEALNGLCHVQGLPSEFILSDFPDYFDGGTVVPFGRPAIHDASFRAALFLEQIRGSAMKLS